MEDIKLHKYNCCDFHNVDSIGVMCRGKSLGKIGNYKKHFKNVFIVGQHYRSFKTIGDHIIGSNIVKLHGSIFNKPSIGYRKQYEKFNMKDMQTYLNPTLSERKKYKFQKISQRNKGFLEVYPIPLNFTDRNKRFLLKRALRDGGKLTHPTLGLFAVDLACAYKPKTVHIIGLDFYCSPNFVIEKKNININKNIPKGVGMIEYFRLLCKEEYDINFYLYTCCKKIKSEGNLKVINV